MRKSVISLQRQKTPYTWDKIQNKNKKKIQKETQWQQQIKHNVDVYVSIGYKISWNDAINITLNVLKFNMCEPIRLVTLQTRKCIQTYEKKQLKVQKNMMHHFFDHSKANHKQNNLCSKLRQTNKQSHGIAIQPQKVTKKQVCLEQIGTINIKHVFFFVFFYCFL